MNFIIISPTTVSTLIVYMNVIEKNIILECFFEVGILLKVISVSRIVQLTIFFFSTYLLCEMRNIIFFFSFLCKQGIKKYFLLDKFPAS